jgi:hypothetical protein
MLLPDCHGRLGIGGQYLAETRCAGIRACLRHIDADLLAREDITLATADELVRLTTEAFVLAALRLPGGIRN